MKNLLSVLFVTSLLFACQDVTMPEQEVGGSPAIQAVSGPPFITGNTTDSVFIGEDWLMFTSQCYAAVFDGGFTFTERVADNKYVLTGTSGYLIEVLYDHKQAGVIYAQVLRKRNRPDRPSWDLVAMAYTLVSQNPTVLFGRVDFLDPNNPLQKIASCQVIRGAWGVVGAMSSSV